MTSMPDDQAAPAPPASLTDSPIEAPTAAAEAAPTPAEAPGDAPAFGWNAYAERLNGRFAMVGFAALLITQLITRQDFWTWIGL